MAREYTRDASEYGQQLIADAIRSLSGSNGGGGSTPSSENIANLLKIHIDTTQTEHQTISYAPFMVGCSINGVPTISAESGANLIEQSSDFDIGLLCQLMITPDEGYTAGVPILPEGITATPSPSPSGTGTLYVVCFPLGYSVTLSATPATPV